MSNRPRLDQCNRHALRGIVLSLALAVGHAHGASADLDSCRSLRHSEPALALEHCFNAAMELQEQRAEEAFEAWLHSAQLASQLGHASRAGDALEAATLLLPRVSDPFAAHRLARRRGLVAYHSELLGEALARFLEGLAIARAEGTAELIAISHNDLGSAYRRMGDYSESLHHYKASLALREDAAQGALHSGTILANIGAVYRELGAYEQSEHFLKQALTIYTEHQRPQPLAHIEEELALLNQARGELLLARTGLDSAWQSFHDLHLSRDQRRVALHRVELEIALGNPDQARLWLDRAQSLVDGMDHQGSLRAAVLAASLAEDDTSKQQAWLALQAAVAEQGADDAALNVLALTRLAELARALDRPMQAFELLQQAHAAELSLQDARHGERFSALRIRFELDQLERDRDRLRLQNALQQADLERRRIQFVALALASLGALGLLAELFRRRLRRQRLLAEQQRQQLEGQIRFARSAAKALESDIGSMEWLLDQQGRAALVFDAGGQVRALTPLAAERLECDLNAARGAQLATLIGAAGAARAQQLVEQASLHEAAPVASALELPGPLQGLYCQRLALEEEMGVLSFGDPLVEHNATPVDDVRMASNEDHSDFRRGLVELMQLSLDAWERSTRKSRIELAECSRIWRITVDDGRLRVRALDRYLALDTIPQRPRWREVLRTAYFVLAECPLDGEQRAQLEAAINRVQKERAGMSTR